MRRTALIRMQGDSNGSDSNGRDSNGGNSDGGEASGKGGCNYGGRDEVSGSDEDRGCNEVNGCDEDSGCHENEGGSEQRRRIDEEQDMNEPALVAVVMGSSSDWETMRHADEVLDRLEVPHYCRVVSAHRTPDAMASFARAAAEEGVEVIVAGAGGAAHLPGMIAAQTHLPVLGVPVESRTLKGVDSLLSIVQMPRGVAVGTLAIGASGAANAALLAAQILALSRPELSDRIIQYREAQTAEAEAMTLPTPNFRPKG